MTPKVHPTGADLTNVKTVRICFLLLLAVLLPIRGVVAAAMLCPAGGSGMQSGFQAQDDGATHNHADHADRAHQHDGDAHHQAGSDKCNMCSAFCSLTPMLSAMPTLAEPAGLTAVEFPQYAAPAPSFISDGQERPPRTL